MWQEKTGHVGKVPVGRNCGGDALNAKMDEFGEVKRNMFTGDGHFGEMSAKSYFSNKNKKQLLNSLMMLLEGWGYEEHPQPKKGCGKAPGNEKISGVAYAMEHLNIDSCAPVDVVEVPMQIKQQGNSNQIEVSSMASGKREWNNIEQNRRQMSHQISVVEITASSSDVKKNSFLHPNNLTTN